MSVRTRSIGLAAALAVLPAVGSQGTGSIAESQTHADSQLVSGETGVLARADRAVLASLAERRAR
jgi:hypothetical protein